MNYVMFYRYFKNRRNVLTWQHLTLRMNVTISTRTLSNEERNVRDRSAFVLVRNRCSNISCANMIRFRFSRRTENHRRRLNNLAQILDDWDRTWNIGIKTKQRMYISFGLITCGNSVEIRPRRNFCNSRNIGKCSNFVWVFTSLSDRTHSLK